MAKQLSTQEHLMELASLTCKFCHGKKIVTQGEPGHEETFPCPVCNGTGRRLPTLSRKCSYCLGIGHLLDSYGFVALTKIACVVCKGTGWMLASNIKGDDVIMAMQKIDYSCRIVGTLKDFWCGFDTDPYKLTDDASLREIKAAGEAWGENLDIVVLEAASEALKEEN